ncbi:MAG: bifunctional tetrahydrofolate synthase/dihydrofolate synthase, partial [Steroidobacteraceae bacterium]
MNLAEWLELQESVHARSIDLGLERVAVVARALGLASPSHRTVTVAGTNGKGSTVTYLEALFGAAGYRTGSFTSPHLLHYNERVRVAGAQATDGELIGAFERIERSRGGTTLTFFEYNTLAALLLFADARVDVAVLEVGLGGRLDATNVLDADVGVLCSIGFDHRDWLGDTLDAIGAEKAGIFRTDRPAVLGTAQMPDSVFTAIERLRARPIVAARDFDWSVEAEHWTYRGLRATHEGLPPPALEGAIQFRNAATALAAYEALPGSRPLDREWIVEALRSARLPGRFQIIRRPGKRGGEVEWILDVSHNEPAAQVLSENLRARPVAGKTLAVSSILRDKDVEAVGRAVASVIDEWIVCAVPGPRGSTAAELAARLAAAVQAPELAGSVT